MGRTVVANLSRSMISTARVRYLFCQAVAISIDAATMRQRLIARGRESQADIEARIARLDLTAPQGYDAVIDNTGPLQDPADRLQAIIASGRNRDRTPMRFTSC
jgi:ribose 1,5-bisphosphokinase